MKPKLKPILFSTPMVQAINKGLKLQTRREIKHKNKIDNVRPVMRCVENEKDWGKYILTDELGEDFLIKPKYDVGDILWVRETFAVHKDTIQGSYAYSEGQTPKYPPHSLDKRGIKRCIDYKADYPKSRLKWKPSIFMTKEACRIFLRVTDVRMERLNDITKADAIDEGLISFYNHTIQDICYVDYTDTHKFFRSPINSYMSLWDKINRKNSNMKNPWVFVYEFERELHYSFDMEQKDGKTFDDNYLAENIVEARTNHDKACEVYRNYVGTAETQEERLRRINAFRCGGRQFGL